MKRILHITGTMNRAGAETMLMNIYREIDRENYQFDFVVFNNFKNDFEDEIIALGGRLYKLNFTNPISRLLALKRLLTETNQYQVVHCHTNFSNAFHLLAAKLAGVKKRIAHSHNTTDKSQNILIRAIYQKVSKLLINKLATDFVSCGEGASSLLFYKHKEILVIPNSVKVSQFVQYEIDCKNYVADMYNLSNDCLKIVQVGRMQSEKNHLFSIEIAKRLKEENFNFKLFFIGIGELEKDLKNKVAQYNLRDVILFLGIRKDVPQFMAGSNVMLMPSFYEGFPVVLVESQAVGLPAIISNTISSEVDLGVNAIFFKNIHSVEDWISEIKLLKEKKVMSKNGRTKKIADKGFDSVANAKFLIDFYNK